jgi:hypothetical protein
MMMFNNQSSITNHQIITNNQFPNNQAGTALCRFKFGYSVIGYWVLIGAWNLVIGYLTVLGVC